MVNNVADCEREKRTSRRETLPLSPLYFYCWCSLCTVGLLYIEGDEEKRKAAADTTCNINRRSKLASKQKWWWILNVCVCTFLLERKQEPTISTLRRVDIPTTLPSFWDFLSHNVLACVYVPILLCSVPEKTWALFLEFFSRHVMVWMFMKSKMPLMVENSRGAAVVTVIF